MGQFGFVSTTFTCLNGAGSISAPGLKVGDRVFWNLIHFMSHDAWQQPGSLFEQIVTVDDELQQLSTDDLSSNTAEVVVIRGP